MDFIQKVYRFTVSHRLIRPGDMIIAGVSGGADSIALLYALARLRYLLGFRLTVAHVNHNLRRQSGSDQAYVQRLARQFELPCLTRSVRIRTSRGKSSIEEAAREQRFAALIHIATKVRADAVALAHHRDDLAETVLMRILRGTGLQGLPAILPAREISGVTFIRPFLDVTRKDILNYLRAEKIPFRNDSTNRQKRFVRNKIRMDLIPELARNYNPNIHETLADLAQNVAVDFNFIQREGLKAYRRLMHANGKKKRVLQVPISRFLQLHLSLQKFICRQAYSELKGDTRLLTSAHLKELQDLLENRPAGSRVDLPSGISAIKNTADLTFLKRRNA